MDKIIEKRIYLEPKYLDSQIKEHILNKLKELTKNECTKDHGHILSINKIINITSVEDTIFNVKMEVKTFKPEENMEINGTICMLYKDGIFVNIYDKQKLLIPAGNAKNYVFDDENGYYISGDKKLKVGNEINIRIIASKYRNHSFSCIGTIV